LINGGYEVIDADAGFLPIFGMTLKQLRQIFSVRRLQSRIDTVALSHWAKEAKGFLLS
jgi:hypothetical protein